MDDHRIEGFAQQAYLKARNVDETRLTTVAFDGDILVAGSCWDDSSATGIDGDPADAAAENSGGVWVFERTDGTWAQTAYLKASNTGADDRFCAVDVSGHTIVVGAPQEDSRAVGINDYANQHDDSVQDSGAVYVFDRIDGSWTQTAYIKASDASRVARFSSVALSGDTLVVGAQWEGSNPSNGAAYIFERDAGVWTETAHLEASNPLVTSHFGTFVDIDGTTAVVSAHYDSGQGRGVNGDQTYGEYRSGAAYVFEKQNGTWTQTAYLKATDSVEHTQFGMGLAISRNVVVVGSLVEAAYIYERVDGAWTSGPRLALPDPPVRRDFARASLAVSGDIIAIGASNEDDASIPDQVVPNSGTVYVYKRVDGVWEHIAHLQASNPDEDDRFGERVAASGCELAAISPHEDSASTGADGEQGNDASNRGAVYTLESLLR
jgi:hypothetical protein